MITSIERSKEENGERRSESTGAHVIAPRFLLCNSGKTAFLNTKTLFLLSDFIFRSGSVPKSLDKMADNQTNKTSETSKSPSKSPDPFNGFDSQEAHLAESRLAELDETIGSGSRQKSGQQGGGKAPLGPSSTSTPLAPRKTRVSKKNPLKIPPAKGEKQKPGAQVGAKTPAGPGQPNRTAPAGKVGPGKTVPTTRKGQPEPPAKTKKRKTGETYAEVVKTAQVCYLREKSGKMLSDLDLVEFQDFVCELDLDQDQVDLTVEKAGYRDGCIWFGLTAKESVDWLRKQMHLLKPWNAEHTGYEFFGPGEMPHRVFFVETSDANALKNDRFVRLVTKNNKKVFANGTDGISVLESKPLKGRPGLLLKVAVDHELAGELARVKFQLNYGMGKVMFQKPMPQKAAKKSKTGIDGDGPRTVGQGQDMDDAMDHDGVIDVDKALEDSGDDDLAVDVLITAADLE